MQTIVETKTNLSKYIIEDDVLVVLEENRTLVGDLVVCDLNVSNAVLYSGVTPPSNWGGNKYRYDGSKWTHYNDMGYLSVEDAKAAFRLDLEKLGAEILLLVMKCKMLIDPIPAELQSVLDMVPVMYSTGKAEIDALTEENYTEYILHGPLVEQLFSALKSFL